MIGDHQGINRTLALQKAVAGFYMVYLHGMTLFGLAIPWIDFTQILPLAKFVSVLKAVLASGLPIFAGFYFRNELGPYLESHRIPARFALIGFKFFLLACVLEGLRLTFVTWSVVYFFDWNALHFIALSMILTYLLLAIDDRLVPLFVVALTLSHSWLSPIFLRFTMRASEVTPALAGVTSWVWWAALASILAWFFTQTQKRLFRKSAGPNRAVMAGALGAAAVIAFFCRAHFVQSSRSVASFVNLPISAFYTNDFDDNYWGLSTAYPIFMFGYYMRAILFNVRYRKFFALTVVTALAGMVQYFIFEFGNIQKLMAARTTWTKAMFMTNGDLFGRLSMFYLIFLLIYYVFAHRRFVLLEAWARASRSILVLYLIHGFFLTLALKVFPFDFAAQYRGQPVDKTLRLVEVYVVAAYVLSLLFTSRITGVLDSHLRRDSIV